MEVYAFGILPVGMLGSYVEHDEVAFSDLSNSYGLMELKCETGRVGGAKEQGSMLDAHA